jgi:ABC-type uncharacterized transport system permease subunit
MIIIAYIILEEYVAYVLTRGILVLVGLLQPLVPLFDQIYTRNSNAFVMARTTPIIGE